MPTQSLFFGTEDLVPALTVKYLSGAEVRSGSIASFGIPLTTSGLPPTPDMSPHRINRHEGQ